MKSETSTRKFLLALLIMLVLWFGIAFTSGQNQCPTGGPYDYCAGGGGTIWSGNTVNTVKLFVRAGASIDTTLDVGSTVTAPVFAYGNSMSVVSTGSTLNLRSGGGKLIVARDSTQFRSTIYADSNVYAPLYHPRTSEADVKIKTLSVNKAIKLLDNSENAILTGDTTGVTIHEGLKLGFYTSDPCGTLPEGSIWYNDTDNVPCYCNQAGADLKISDDSACF